MKNKPRRNRQQMQKRAGALQVAQTAAQQSAFLENFQKLGTILRAAQAANISRDLHYDWIERDPTYPERFKKAGQAFIESLEHEVFRRGVVGFEEPIVYQGKISKDEYGKPLTVRRFSDNLLMFRLKKEDPRYRDSMEIGGPNGGPIQVDAGIDRAVDAFLRDLARLAARGRAAPPALEAHTTPSR